MLKGIKVTFGLRLAGLLASMAIALCSCAQEESKADQSIKKAQKTRVELEKLLQAGGFDEDSRCALVKQIAQTMMATKDYNSLIIFLTDWVEKNPDDKYNAYWLLMTANAYLENDSRPIARYYLERIIKNYPDLMVQGQSIHFLSLQKLIRISETSENRITYFNQLVSQFPNNVNITEIYYRLALEYENEGEWDQALKTFDLFLNRADAQNIQIQGRPNAYASAKQLIDFSKSSKDWTFATLEDLVSAVKVAINKYDWRALDRYRSKVNFFAMSWRQDDSDENSQRFFSMHDYMRGNKIHCTDKLDPSSTPTEAYFRTWGWSVRYVNVWYLYFRKVNFPSDPSVHGRWEWAGIYYGEKL
ncbi:MAG: tetratricopeptide repeat protein [Treponema sp.]|nr:tetratricopeptide repeat protein [Treponema sp.]